MKISIVTKNERISKHLNDKERSILPVLFAKKGSLIYGTLLWKLHVYILTWNRIMSWKECVCNSAMHPRVMVIKNIQIFINNIQYLDDFQTEMKRPI